LELNLFKVLLVNHPNDSLYLAVGASANAVEDEEFIDKVVFLVHCAGLDLVSEVHRMLEELLVSDTHSALVLLGPQHV